MPRYYLRRLDEPVPRDDLGTFDSIALAEKGACDALMRYDDPYIVVDENNQIAGEHSQRLYDAAQTNPLLAMGFGVIGSNGQSMFSLTSSDFFDDNATDSSHTDTDEPSPSSNQAIPF